MKQFLKNIISGLLRRLLDLYFSDLNNLNNPYKINFNKGSSLGYPLKVGNGENIYVGKHSFIGKLSWIEVVIDYSESKSAKIDIGNNVCIGNFACITALSEIIIRDGTLISEHFYASDHTHGFDPLCEKLPINQPLVSKGSIFIGENCFIGYRVTILPGVHIGKYCVVGAHSVVTSSFPDYTMIAGVPARAIKKFNIKTKQWEKI